MDPGHSKKISTAGLLITLGIIFGDIGTSPLYTFQTILLEGGKVSEELVLGAISCVFWTLTLQTTFKYVFITLRADNRGEGGVFSLYALVRRYGKRLVFPAIIGAGTLLADGIITPPISVSATAWADLDVLCLNAMHKDPLRRYRSVEALMRDVDNYLNGEPLEARPDAWQYRISKFVRRNRRAVASTALIFALVVGLVAFFTVRLAKARDTALAEAARWARDRAAILVDTHWVGGDPGALAVYGHAALGRGRGTLVLRNPKDVPQGIEVDIGEALELPAGAPRRYSARSPWQQDRGRAPILLDAAMPHRFDLAPFEVLTLDVVPVA